MEESYRRVRGRLFRIPLWQRMTHAAVSSLLGKRVAMCLDGIGFIYQYSEEKDLGGR